MEEDIDILEDFLEYNNFLERAVVSGDIREFEVYMSKNDYKAIQNLIARYKEEKEKNALLLANNNGYYDLKEYLKENYIPKSKVQEKIEELEELVKDFEEYWSKDPRKFKKEKCIDYYKLEALQELLED